MVMGMVRVGGEGVKGGGSKVGEKGGGVTRGPSFPQVSASLVFCVCLSD